MPAGLQVFNDSSTIQIDSTWANYSLFSVVTVNSTFTQWGEPNYAGAVYSTNVAADIVFASSSSPFFPVCIVQVSGTRQYRVGTGKQQGVPVTFYIFRKQPPRESTYGMQVFDAQGTLVFDALDKMCRIAGIIPSSQLSSPNSYFFKASRQYAVLAPSFTGQLIEQDSAPDAGGMGFKFLGTNSAQISLTSSGINTMGYAVASERQIPIQNPRPGIRVTNVIGADYIVCDITGYSL